MLRIPKAPPGMPTLTIEQMREVDRLMEEDYGISPEQMMENAGLSLAVLARDEFLKGNCRNRGVMVLAGTGGNGAGAMVCARRLHNWGARVRVILPKPVHEYQGVPRRQLETLQKMGIVLLDAPAKNTELLIDGLIGYGLSGDPYGRTADLIQWANRQILPILSLDVPSGLNSDTGEPGHPCIHASATLAVALPKAGLMQPIARAQVGELFLTDISVPRSLYAAPGLDLNVGPIFAEGHLLRVHYT
jgi:NAD(P)H-hydrate epimerase